MGSDRRFINAPGRLEERQHERLVTAGTDEAHEIGGGEPRRGIDDHERHALIVLHVIEAMPSSSRLAKSLFRSPAMGAEITPVSIKCSFPRKFC